MKKNTRQFEPCKKRLTRFLNNPPSESIETLLNSIDNFLNNEIVSAVKQHQTSLLFIGIHAVALTLSEIFWNLKGERGLKKFLETFVDGETEDTKFSNVAPKIHKWRNALVHQWLISSGYKIQYDYNMKIGFKTINSLLKINPKIFCVHYMNAFSSSGKIWNYDKILTKSELDNAKKIIIDKFVQI